jgi:hypothetical protein
LGGRGKEFFIIKGEDLRNLWEDKGRPIYKSKLTMISFAALSPTKYLVYQTDVDGMRFTPQSSLNNE